MAKFQKGSSGNPQGRPHGIEDKRSSLRKLLEPHAEALIKKAVEVALSGDSHALRLCLERLIPRAKEESIIFSLPNDITKVEAIVEMGTEVLRGIEKQEVTPEQAKTLFEALKVYRENILSVDFDRRLSELEEKEKCTN